MKLVFLSLCLIVALAQAEQDEAVTLIKDAINGFPVEKMVESVEKLFKGAFRQATENRDFVEAFPEMEWKDADALANKLFPHDPDLKDHFKEYHTKVMEDIDWMKSTSVRDLFRSNRELNGAMSELFSYADEEAESDQKGLINNFARTFHEAVQKGLHDIQEQVNRYAIEIEAVEENNAAVRRRRDYDNMGGLGGLANVMNGYESKRKEYYEAIQKFADSLLQGLKTSLEEEMGEGNTPIEIRRKLVLQVKSKVDFWNKEMEKCDIEEVLKNNEDRINEVVGYIQNMETGLKKNLQTIRTKMSETSIWNVVENVWNDIVEDVISPYKEYVSNVYDEVEDVKFTEEQVDEHAQQALWQLAGGIETVNTGVQTYFDMVDARYQNVDQDTTWRHRRSYDMAEDAESMVDTVRTQFGDQIESVKKIFGTLGDKIPFDVILNGLQKLIGKLNTEFTDEQITDMVNNNWVTLEGVAEPRRIQLEEMVGDAEKKGEEFITLLKKNTPYQLAKLISEKYYAQYMKPRLDAAQEMSDDFKLKIKEVQLKDLEDQVKESIISAIDVMVGLAGALDIDISSFGDDIKNQAEDAKGISDKQYQDVMDKIKEKGNSAKDILKKWRENEYNLAKTIKDFDMEDELDEDTYNAIVRADRLAVSYREIAENKNTMDILAPLVTKVNDVVENYKQKVKKYTPTEQQAKQQAVDRLSSLRVKVRAYLDMLAEYVTSLRSTEATAEPGAFW